MKLKVHHTDRVRHGELVSAVSWTSSNELISVSDDRKVLRWSINGEGSEEVVSNTENFCTSMHCHSSLSRMSSGPGTVSGKGSHSIAIGFTNAQIHIVNATSGRLEHTANQPQHQGAITCIRWNSDGSALVTVGEDGRVLQWSKTVNLRSKLAQNDNAIYCVAWSPDDQAVVFATAQFLCIKPLQVSSPVLKWKAHSGTILCVDWSPLSRLIISGGEDGRFVVSDEFGRVQFVSAQQDHAISSVSWAPSGELFAVGTLNTIILCDKTGWVYSSSSIQTGSVLSLSWTQDGTHLSGATASGAVVFAQLVDRMIQWNRFEAVLNENNQIVVTDVLNETNFAEELEFSDHVIEFSMGFGHFVVTTSRHCYIYSVDNFSTPHIFELKGKVHLIVQSQNEFLTVDSIGGICVHSYDGRQLCNPRVAGLRTDLLRKGNISINSDFIVIIDLNHSSRVLVLDTSSGRSVGRALEHSAAVVEVALGQAAPSADRKLAFIDRNSDLFLADLHRRHTHKLASMCESLLWNDDTNMLAAMVDGNLKLFYYPAAAFLHEDLLDLTTSQIDDKFGRNARLVFFNGGSCTVRRTDGAFLSESVSPYIATLYHLTTQSHWTQAIRLARFVDDKVVWAVLASTAIFEGELESAEISLASIEAVDKLQHIQYIRTLPNKARRDAELAVLRHRVDEGEQILLHNKMPFRAIQLNLRLYRFERALELSRQNSCHLETVLAHRQRYLERFRQKESVDAFRRASAGAEGVDWHRVEQLEREEDERETASHA